MSLYRATARALIAWVFLHGGAATLGSPEPRARAATAFLRRLRAAIPFLPADATLVRGNAAAQVAAGAMLAAGAWERQAACVLAASLIPTTIAGHPFWSARDPASRGAEAIAFGKNMGILGALLLLACGRAAAPHRERRPA
ncbi:MAG TPA: DoxX family membrane protein [Streptosporangiaceae bacterium]|nr:DoxX family membrane protein [Streptosporangiaceae bacterium]